METSVDKLEKRSDKTGPDKATVGTNCRSSFGAHSDDFNLLIDKTSQKTDSLGLRFR